MDHHESKGSETESICGHPSSPVKQSLSTKTESLVDANVRMQKLGYEYDRGTESCKDEKLSKSERNDHIPYPACVKDGKVDKQCKTESSSSNTPYVILPASSNDSYQETSLEIQSCKLSKIYGTDSSTCTELKADFKECSVGILQPRTKTHNSDEKLELGISPAKCCGVAKGFETIDSFRTRNRDNLSGVRSSDNLSVMSSENDYAALENLDVSNADRFKKEIKKAMGHSAPVLLRKLGKADDIAPADAKEVDQEFEASGSCSVDGRNSEIFRVTYADSSSRKSIITEISGSVSQQPESHDKSFSSRDRIDDLSCLDLNEDAQDHDGESLGWLGKLSVPTHMASVSKPKPVMAKPGTPFCFLSSNALNNEIPGGWRGCAANSAFRPTSKTKNSIENKGLLINDDNGADKHRIANCIDLNLDAGGAECELDSLQDKSFPSNSEVGTAQARKFDFDLNCVGENDDLCCQSYPKTSLREQSVRDFDLNENLAPLDSCNEAYLSGQVTKELRKMGSNSPAVSWVENSKQQELQTFRPTFSTDLHSVPGYIPGHVPPFLVAPPNMLHSSEQLQRLSFLQPQLAPAFRVNPKDGLSAAVVAHGMIPYMVDPHATAMMSQVLGSGAVPAFPGQVFQVSQVSSGNSIAVTGPKISVYNGVNAVENINRGANSGQLYFPSGNSTLEEQMKSFQQVGVLPSAMKRREPEGGWDSHQLHFRHMTSWR